MKRVARLVPVYYFSLLPALPSFYVYTQTPVFTGITTFFMIQSLAVPSEGWNFPLWQISAFALSYIIFPYVLRTLRVWSSSALRKLMIILMITNVIVVVITMFLLPLVNQNVGILHRWGPFRLPQFVMGIAAGLLAQRGEFSGSTRKADIITLILTFSALIICPVLVHISPMFTWIGVPLWDFYNTVAEYIVGPLHAYWLIELTVPNSSSISKKLFLSPPLKFLGEISYSFYCLHAPILYLAGWTIKNQGVNYDALPLILEPNTGIHGLFVFPPWAFIPLLGVIIPIAAASNWFIEKPARKLLVKWSL